MRFAVGSCAVVLFIVFVGPAQARDVILEHMADIRNVHARSAPYDQMTKEALIVEINKLLTTLNGLNECNACESFPCKNGGTCVPTGTNRYRCVCPINKSGKNCEDDLLQCTASTCAPNSDCIVANGTIKCVCKQGYSMDKGNCVPVTTGATTSTTPSSTSTSGDPCISTYPCENDGICQYSPEASPFYTCLCPENTLGYNCEALLQCTDTTCGANADCSVDDSLINCACKNGFIYDQGGNCVPRVVTTATPSTTPSTTPTKPSTAPSSMPTSTTKTSTKPSTISSARDPCSTTFPCQNGGTCKYFPSAMPFYICVCPNNTLGYNCESIVNVLKCEATSCTANSDCFVANDQINCVCKQGYTMDQKGNCGVKVREACMWGDPHYTSFDGLKFDYQGTCPYVVTQPCDFDISPYFSIRAKNTQFGTSRVSGVTWTELNIHGVLFAVNERLQLTVDGVAVSVPYQYIEPYESDWKVKASVAGGFMYITTREQVEIKFALHKLCVTVPEKMVSGSGRLCGLFGDVDNKCQNDLRGVKKSLFGVPSASCVWPASGSDGMVAERFGDDWADLKDGKCIPGTVLKNTSLPCTPAQYMDAKLACQAIELAKTGKGIFGKCAGLGAKLDDLLNACAYDVCADKSLRCNALTDFVRTCQQILPGTTLSGWRNNVTCPLACRANQYYSDCMSSCPATCANTTVSAICNKPCVEGCTCSDGNVLDGTGLQCVPQKDCGCTDTDGNYYEAGAVWMSADCKKVSKCMKFGNKIVKDVTCGERGTCGSDRQCACQSGNVGTCKNAALTMADMKEYQLCSCAQSNEKSKEKSNEKSNEKSKEKSKGKSKEESKGKSGEKSKNKSAEKAGKKSDKKG